MIDLQQGTDRFDQVSSKDTSSSKFNFWKRKETRNCEDDADFQSSPIEFQTEKGDYSAYSPPLWSNKSNVNSNLLPHDHRYSSPSPTSRLQAIEDGRIELMEMVKGMPESSYELSLEDIVDDGTKMEVKQDTKKKSERNNNKGTLKRHSRSQSMNDEVFLLKMFLPSCLSCKKKTTLENHSKVSRMPSFDRYEKPMDKERWSIGCLVSRKNRSNSSGSSSSSSSGSTGCNSSSTSRRVDSNYTAGCMTSDNLSKSRGHRGCLF
ncbi:hypothetical protein POM88_037576 [Heracleum sosnowskyi]|uniref:Uncharacterized protein n=1 Tax=Heracleum sosnowskyi TaxID=360622 RepID=A0AAD8HQE4_9APIA|nr:hypothetical protein POM88_037576 [Heracleum sosnowskyi]